MRHLSLVLSTSFLLMACASPTVVEKQKFSDGGLSCLQLEEEMKDVDSLRTKAEQEKGVTGTNVAAAVFFWPAMLGTYSNANTAIAAANDRKSHLLDLYRSKGCSGSQAQAKKSPKEIEADLESLVRLKEKGLITPQDFEDKKRKLIESMN